MPAIWSIIIALSVILDRVTKHLAVKYVMPNGKMPFIDGVLGFKYAENTGMAFGLMKNMRWVFIVTSTVVIIALLIFMIVRKKDIPPLLGISLSMVIGGGLGNQIDRIFYGYVVDFLEFQFVDFAIFNVADSFVTVGVVLIILDILFINKEAVDVLFGDKKTKKEKESE